MFLSGISLEHLLFPPGCLTDFYSPWTSNLSPFQASTAFPCTSEFACSNYYENLNRNILCRFFTLHLCIYRLVWNLCNECSLSSTVFKIPFHPHGCNSLRSPFRYESPFPVEFNTEEVCIISLGLGSLMPFSESGHIGDISDTSPSAALSRWPISPFLICAPSGFSTGYSIPVSKAVCSDQRALSPDMAVIIADIPQGRVLKAYSESDLHTHLIWICKPISLFLLGFPLHRLPCRNLLCNLAVFFSASPHGNGSSTWTGFCLYCTAMGFRCLMQRWFNKTLLINE